LPDPGIADELQQILIPRDNHDLQGALDGLLGEGGNDVICLMALPFHARNAMHPHQFLDVGNLYHQVFRHLLAGGLVKLVHGVSVGRARRIEDHAQIVRLLFADHLGEHLRETIDGLGGHSTRIREAPQGIKRPIEVGTPINEVEGFLRRHRLHRVFVRPARFA